MKSSNLFYIKWNIIPNLNSSIFKKILQKIGSISWWFNNYIQLLKKEAGSSDNLTEFDCFLRPSGAELLGQGQQNSPSLSSTLYLKILISDAEQEKL